MDPYSFEDYKELIRARIREERAAGKPLTLKNVAQKVGVQYTYLSRALNQESVHLGEEHLFSVCRALGFFAEEIDYVILLRSLALAASRDRREYLLDKINRMRRARQLNATVREVDSRQLHQEMSYLFDPICTLVLISLTIPEFLAQPSRIAPLLGLSNEHYQASLRTLRELGFIEMDESGHRIAKVIRRRFHYGTDHPFMRMHQMMLRNLGGARLAQLPEGKKQCLMTTFSADPATIEAMRNAFQGFLRDAEAKVHKARPQKVYQMNFELFEWF